MGVKVDDLTIVGLILVIVGVVMAPITCFTTLLLAFVGLLLLISGGRHNTPRYAYYPIYKHCAGCGRQIEPSHAICPFCQKPTSP